MKRRPGENFIGWSRRMENEILRSAGDLAHFIATRTSTGN